MQLVIHYFLHRFEGPTIPIIFINRRQVNWLYGNLPWRGHCAGDWKPTSITNPLSRAEMVVTVPNSFTDFPIWTTLCTTAVKACSFGLCLKPAVTKLSLCAQLPWTGLNHHLVFTNKDTGQIWHTSKNKALRCHGGALTNLISRVHVRSSSLISHPTNHTTYSRQDYQLWAPGEMYVAKRTSGLLSHIKSICWLPI